MTIPTIFEIEGEASFRDREEAVLAELTDRSEHRARDRRRRRDPRPANRERLKRERHRVYLHAMPETLCERIRHSRHRPLLKAADPVARLAELYAERDPLYREDRRPRDRVRSRRQRVMRFARTLEAAAGCTGVSGSA